jgi:hypothetical protein
MQNVIAASIIVAIVGEMPFSSEDIILLFIILFVFFNGLKNKKDNN